MRLFTGIATLVALTACRPPETPEPGHLQFDAPAIEGAQVVIDDQPLGSLDFVRARGVAVLPGKHFVSVEARGYFPMDAEVDVASGQTKKLRVSLSKLPD